MNKWYKVALISVLVVAIACIAVIIYNDNQETGKEVAARSPQINSVNTSHKIENKNIGEVETLAKENKDSPAATPKPTAKPAPKPKSNTTEVKHDSKPTPSNSITTSPEPTKQIREEPKAMETKLFSENDVIMIAKTLGVECPSVKSITEQACVVWCILNRYDAGFAPTISAVITAPNQFAYYSYTTVRQDLYNLALDVLTRWEREKNGEVDVGRVLPKDYMWYSGDLVAHNYFRNQYRGGDTWNYSLPSPYNT